MLTYPAVFEPAEEGGYVVTFPDFDFGGTQGDTETEAYEMAQDLLLVLIGHLMKNRQEIPLPGKLRGKHVRGVPLAALTAAKIGLYREMRAAGIRKADLGRRMGQPKQQIERLLNLRHLSRIEQIEAALAALGKRLSVSVQDAA